MGSIRREAITEDDYAILRGEDPVNRRVTRLISEPRVQAALIDALNRQDTVVIARAYDFFIAKGIRGSKAALVKTLHSDGDAHMAWEFANGGDPELEAAASEWAARRGQGFRTFSVRAAGSVTKWGGTR